MEGTERALTTGKWSVGAGELRGPASIPWTPDSQTIALNAVRDANADMQTSTSFLYVVDVASGNIRELVNKPGSWSKPKVSPDGRVVAFTGYAASPSSYTVEAIHLVPIGGGEAERSAVCSSAIRSI